MVLCYGIYIGTKKPVNTDRRAGIKKAGKTGLVGILFNKFFQKVFFYSVTYTPDFWCVAIYSYNCADGRLDFTYF